MIKKTNFKNIDSEAPFCKSTQPLEVDNIQNLTENILAEFTNSTDEEKREYRKMILKWLRKNRKTNLSDTEEKELRDFIYEMY